MPITNGVVITILLLHLSLHVCVLCEELEPNNRQFKCVGDSCVDSEDFTSINHEKIKYHTEQVTDKHFEDTDIESDTKPASNIDDDSVKEEGTADIEDTSDDIEKQAYEFPTLSRLDPGEVGDEVEVELDKGVWYKRITKAIQPPVFEIPNFLSDEECDLIIESAKKNGLNISNVFGDDVYAEFEDEIPLAEISRVSEQTWLDSSSLDSEFLTRLQHRVAKLTELPVQLIERSEPIQVVSYVPGGHYHAHLDTIDGDYDKPCCFQTHCGEKEETSSWNECCRLCRFITVLYYLNDPDAGGETAFPVADMSDELVEEKFINIDDQDWYNLSYYCHDSSLVVKPKRGTAIMWYSHFVDEQTGYLGLADRRSHHGGCDLKKGTKWIANNWISAPTREGRFDPSVFFHDN